LGVGALLPLPVLVPVPVAVVPVTLLAGFALK
jgi:hypothetical protein